jgi:O-acetyl-ADP-ribose deacetylase (regulator of RNase III)
MQHVFRLARDHGVRTIAVPAVGTGIAGFPIDACARVMAACLHDALDAGWEPQEVRFVLFDDHAKRVFEPAFRAVFEASGGAIG